MVVAVDETEDLGGEGFGFRGHHELHGVAGLGDERIRISEQFSSLCHGGVAFLSMADGRWWPRLAALPREQHLVDPPAVMG